MKSKHFKVHELVPKALYDKYGEKAWRYVPKALIRVIDDLKEKFPEGSMTINNYYWNGSREWSGIRTGDSKYYSIGSQHSYGNALDIVWSKYTAVEVRKYILEEYKAGNPIYTELGGLEIASWVHLDVRNEDELVIFDKNNKVYTIDEALQLKD